MADRPAKAVEKAVKTTHKTDEEVRLGAVRRLGGAACLSLAGARAAKHNKNTTTHTTTRQHNTPHHHHNHQERNDIIGLVLGVLVTSAGAALTGVFGDRVRKNRQAKK